ncbi:MAG: bifunctional DNA-formamidopyrimidine glycosylase/DNA-(apurinic or apyrimidinic site) lyase [Gammaproteobacteria bacterium]|nr:bifunctional DNA-formamidopyrimidine glycosylase/DNA-(apurinic or apyrimidinic site) lyase [Gammaproteobacteria bacterium]
MPELPEVETICRGITPVILGQKITSVTVRNHKLRCPIPKNLSRILKGQYFLKTNRRGKYILLKTKDGALIMHLGMSGNLQIKPKNHIPTKHEHVSINFANNLALCYNDPRRFGVILWTTKEPLKHKLLKNLGPEPFSDDFTAEYLFNSAKLRRCPIKQFIMNSNIVTGVGNIYANEALFASKINPLQKANTITLACYKKLVKEIKKILLSAIKHGGTTIKDHTDSSGKQGLFQNKLKVYGRHNQSCYTCKTKLTTIKIGQRATVFCSRCQKNNII